MGKIKNPACEIQKAGERLLSRRLSRRLDTLISTTLGRFKASFSLSLYQPFQSYKSALLRPVS